MTTRPMTAELLLYPTGHTVAAFLQQRPPVFGNR